MLTAGRRCGLYAGMRYRHRRDLLVLTYHSVVDVPPEALQQHPLVYRNAVRAAHFAEQMRHLRRHHTLLDGDALRAVLDGAPLPPRAALVTFDDGLRNNATVALPLLQRLGIPAVFFLPTAFLTAASNGRVRRHWTEDLVARWSVQAARGAVDWTPVHDLLPNWAPDPSSQTDAASILDVIDYLKALPRAVRAPLVDGLRDAVPPVPADAFPADAEGTSVLETMTWDEANDAAQQGVTLGAHTVRHAILSRLDPDAARTEIVDSLRAVRERTGQPADLFAYPNGGLGDFSTVHQQTLADAGCRAAFTQIPGFNAPDADPLALRRIDVSPDFALPTFDYLASGTKVVVDRLFRGRPPRADADTAALSAAKVVER